MGRALEETEGFSSPSEVPVAADLKSEDREVRPGEEVESEDFEFRVSVSGGLHPSSSAADGMCDADEVFFRGQMLPLRRPWGDSGASRSRSSASDSRSTSRSSSSGSHSSGSRLSSGSSGERPRAAPTVSNNFYARPSPSPRILSAGRTSAGWRRSASAAPPGWGAVFRLGVAKAPEIDIRSRGSANGRKKVAPPGGRWSCKCLPDAVEPTAVSNSADRKKKDETRRRDLQ
ncbi:hypothetical protein ZIOFF_030716 [Zingiber officinale]|uniref:Uncharacterized protein n=1 Tax=Zingiber officinale TaxID=94328 RepID=A0A8J5LBV6_ZINOF|nr:hypothetical protein ZIOFF_030716 [Zingiber officinale]